jgi:hypothetical protein
MIARQCGAARKAHFVHDNGAAGVGSGILIKPPAGGSAEVSLSDVNVYGNANGILADSSTTSAGGTNRMSVSDSLVSGSTGFGVRSLTGANIATIYAPRLTYGDNQGSGNLDNGSTPSPLDPPLAD